MEHFATTTLPELATVLGTVFAGFAAILVGFYKYAQWQFTQAQRERKEERQAFQNALKNMAISFENASKDMADSNREIAKYTKEGNEQAEQRNGHLAELTIESSAKLLEAVAHLQNQNVTEQHVEHQTIEKKG